MLLRTDTKVVNVGLPLSESKWYRAWRVTPDTSDNFDISFQKMVFVESISDSILDIVERGS